METQHFKHTFLFEEHDWIAQGHYINAFGSSTAIEGMCVIQHDSNTWIVENTFYLSTNDNQHYRSNEFKNVYRVEAFANNHDSTPWRTIKSSMGKLEGHMVVLEDTILSVFRSFSGQTQGTECFVKVSDQHYRLKGALFEGQEKVSSWVLNLTR